MMRRLVPAQRKNSICENGRSSCGRQGLTLIEVVLALSIFLISAVSLGQLVATGTHAAVLARLQTKAVLHCETKIAEVLTGIIPMESVDSQQMEDDPDWVWSLDVQTGPHPDLLQLIVTVEFVAEGSLAASSFSLSRLVRDPEIFLEEDLVEDE